MKSLTRRDFLRTCAGGLVAVAAGSVTIPDLFMSGVNRYAVAATGSIDLTFSEALVETYDLRQVYMWLFADRNGPAFPGPVIMATEGDVLEINLTNSLDEPHAFKISGTDIKTGPIAPSGTAGVKFLAPRAGTYIYYDPENDPVNRVLGLHGVLISMPRAGNTPYRNPTPIVQQLFDDLGTTTTFPGEGWAPERRTKLWVFHGIDPRWNDLAHAGRPIDPGAFKANWLTRYFTINGHSGFFASHDHDTVPSGFVGQPHLIRIANTGMNSHAAHIHGNHVFVLSRNGQVQSNVLFLDVATIGPMDRVDWMLPFMRPPDIPGPKNVPLRTAAREELAFVDSYGIAQRPLKYPMHCHTEMSQTAAGGNYPGGLTTHWEIIGDLDGVPF